MVEVFSMTSVLFDHQGSFGLRTAFIIAREIAKPGLGRGPPAGKLLSSSFSPSSVAFQKAILAPWEIIRPPTFACDPSPTNCFSNSLLRV